MNEKLKPLLQLIALACGLIFIVLVVASFVISSTEEPNDVYFECDEEGCVIDYPYLNMSAINNFNYTMSSSPGYEQLYYRNNVNGSLVISTNHNGPWLTIDDLRVCQLGRI